MLHFLLSNLHHLAKINYYMLKVLKKIFLKQSDLSKTPSEYLIELILYRKEMVLFFVIVLGSIATEFTSYISVSNILIPLVNTLERIFKLVLI